jgi:selenocysteine-specific elongation factor
MVAAAGRQGFPRAALISRAGIDPSQTGTCLARLTDTGAAVEAGDVLVAADVMRQLKKGIVDLVGEHHRTSPLSTGLPREELRERLFGRGHPAVFARAVEELSSAGLVAGRDRLMLATHSVVLSDEESRASALLEDALRHAGLTPGDPSGYAAAAGVPPAVASRVLQLLQRQKRIVRVGDLLFHEDALRALKLQVAALKNGTTQAAIDVATFKEKFGVTRKFAIPLLEYLDRERVTRRMGDRRLIL